uniref:Putative secreted protein n=1 Tax=Anopheles marajoara TaxID=58244 RepID=A0A2M4C8G4_9DIPT
MALRSMLLLLLLLLLLLNGTRFGASVKPWRTPQIDIFLGEGCCVDYRSARWFDRRRRYGTGSDPELTCIHFKYFFFNSLFPHLTPGMEMHPPALPTLSLFLS